MPKRYKLFFLSWVFLLMLRMVALAAEPVSLPPVLTNPSDCGLGLPINDFSCNASHQFSIDVTSAGGSSLGHDVFLSEVRIIINHEWAADLDMKLTSPGGVSVVLSTDNGSSGNNYGIYNGNGCGQFTSFISNSLPGSCNTSPVTLGAAPFLGEFLPEETLNNFYDGSDPNGIWILEICDDGKEHYGTLEFVELVFEPTACLQPALVTADSITAGSVKLDWQESGTCVASIVEYGPAGTFTPGSGYNGGGTVAVFSGPAVLLDGLLPSTDYEVYVRKDCGSGNFSANACPVFFTTLCAPPPATISEDFNAIELCEPFCGIPCEITGTWRNVPNDHFDWIVNAGPTGSSSTGPIDDLPGGGRYIYIETSGTLCRNGNEAALVSNCIEVHANGGGCDMSFNYILYGTNVNGVWLEVTTDGGQTWETLWSATGNLGEEWFQQYVDLSNFDGQVVQFRFLGRGGNGFRGDIALDNLVFYGSVDLGFPPFVKYLDADSDGYGRPDVFIATCSDVDFPGYVSNPDDCDDDNFFKNPGVIETPCDGVDENCNGDDDEFSIPQPVTVSDTVCSGQTGFVSAQPDFGGQINWYDAETGGNLLHSGENFSPADFPENNSPDPVTLTFFAEEISPAGCTSVVRQAAVIVILPQPKISTDDTPLDCANSLFNLATVNVVDANGTSGVLSYHTAFPPTMDNQIAPQVQPAQTTTYIIRSTAAGGCSDTTSVTFTALPAPIALISGDTAICLGASGVLTVADIGNGVPPVAIEWNNSATTSQITVPAGAAAGAVSIYAVEITGANGCIDSDTITVETVTSMESVLVSTTDVSVCDGDDGSIILIPVDGTSPYNYFWNGGSATGETGGLTLNGLSQGTYSFTITDASPEGCAFTVPVVVVNGPAASVSVDLVDPVNCYGGSDGCISIDVTGSNPSILWSTGDTTPDVCGLAAGTYTVTVTDGNCENVLTIPMPEPSDSLFVKPDARDVSCFGENDGQIFLTVLGGTQPYQFQWSNGQIFQNINNLAPGVFSVTVTDARGCEKILGPLVVTEPAPLSIDTLAFEMPNCFGENTGSLTVDAVGGNAPFNFAWSNGGMGNTLTNLPGGNYSVTVSDVKGCTFAQTVFLTEPTPVSVTIDELDEPSCNGIDDGEIQITATGGAGGYSYLWNDSLAHEDISGIGPGQYTVVATDQNGCTGMSDTVEITGLEEFRIYFFENDPMCVGVDNGSIEIDTATGGTAPYQFFWSTDETGTEISNLPSDTYCVTLVDAMGCRYDTCVTLEETQRLEVFYEAFPPACHGTATGQLVLTVDKGVEPYTIEWSGAHTGPVYSGLTAGNYTSTVTDFDGCQFYLDLINLPEPDPLEILVDNVESIACHGGQEGSIEVSIAGGTEPYSFHWSNNDATEDIGSLAQGNYYLTVNDANNCVTVSPPIEVISPEPIQAASNLVVPPGCEAVLVDTVCVDVTGGVFPYEFEWNTGSTAPCLIDEPSGDYHVTITDAAGCTFELMSVKVPEIFIPLSVDVAGDGISSICHGSGSGTATAIIDGGAGPYQFNWNNGTFGLTSEDTLTIENLSPGSYHVTITDNNGCTAVSSPIIVADNGSINITVPSAQIQHVKCRFGSDGAIGVNVSGGQPGYSFVWTNQNNDTIAFTEDVNGLLAGTYTLLVTDEIGCTGSQTVTINQPAQILSILSPPPLVDDVSCFGELDGKINITPTGGVPPYQFNWSNGAMTEDLSGIGAGVYGVTILDANICAYIPAPIEIEAPEAPLYLADVFTQDVTCAGGSDGLIDIDMSGGTPDYIYSWNLLTDEEDLLGIPAGSYHLKVYDLNSCFYDTIFVIGEPDALQLSAEIFHSTAGQDNGVVIPSAAGGTPPYLFLLDNGASGDTLTELAPGFYELTVLDGNACEASVWVEIETIVEVSGQEVSAAVKFYPNPASGLVNFDLNVTRPIDIDLKIFNLTGQCIFSKNEEKMQRGIIQFDFQDRAAGTYFAFISTGGRIIYQTKILVVH